MLNYHNQYFNKELKKRNLILLSEQGFSLVNEVIRVKDIELTELPF